MQTRGVPVVHEEVPPQWGTTARLSSKIDAPIQYVHKQVADVALAMHCNAHSEPIELCRLHFSKQTGNTNLNSIQYLCD